MGTTVPDREPITENTAENMRLAMVEYFDAIGGVEAIDVHREDGVVRVTLQNRPLFDEILKSVEQSRNGHRAAP